MTTVAELVAEARSWVGVPWHHQGRSRAGVDCVGLIECVLAATAGLPPGYRTPRNYSRLSIDDSLIEHLDRWCDRVECAPGAVLVFRFRAGRARHVALLAGETIIHALTTARQVVEQRYGEPWVRQTIGAWSLPGVAGLTREGGA